MLELKTISHNNRKLGAIPSISFPPVVTCANCKECSKKCYALKMAKFHKSVGKAWEKNLEIWKENPKLIYMEISLVASYSRYFRYFVGGDIPDMAFLNLMLRIANENPACDFLAFTKKYELVNEYLKVGTLPRNLHIIFSKWGNKAIPNPYNVPTSNVIFRKQEAPTESLICGGNCTTCLCQGIGCWNLKKGQEILFYEH